MGDFSQNGIISTLHDFGTKSTSTIEKELLKHSAERKMELILPSLYSELEGSALPKIVEEISKKLEMANLLKLKKSPLPFSFPILIIAVTPTPIATM